MGLGLFAIFLNKASPLPPAIVLLIFSVVFIAGMVFFEKHSLSTLSSIILGALAGFVLCFVVVLFVGGLQFTLGGGISIIGWNQVISAVAVSMITSIIMLKVLSYKLQKNF
jgi:hypothetical protein